MLVSLLVIEQASEVWEQIKTVFTNFDWTIIFSFLVLLVMFYFVFKTLYDNNAGRFIALYVLLIVAGGIIALFSRGFSASGYFVYVTVLSAVFLLLFSIEIKRIIYRVGAHQPNSSGANTRSKANPVIRADESMSAIVKAVQNLSKNNIGALIVLSNGNLPKEIVDSGVSLGAKISNQLIEGIFIPKAPLHDGAMIIYGDKIQAAGCFLPLTQRDFPKDYGTRHRAGIGVTEVADVSTIIVSEETGIVSIVRRGEITRYVDSETLKRFLREYYWKEFLSDKDKK